MLRYLGQVVRAHRVRLQLTQETAAAAIGVDQSTWSRLERGRWAPDIIQAVQIVRIVDLPSVELLYKGAFPSRQALNEE